MEDEGSPMPTPLLLGRPFMKTARTKIDVYNGTLTMEFDGEIASFQVLEDKGNPSEFNSCYAINVFDFVMQQNPKGPYKENEGKDEKGCDLMKKKKDERKNKAMGGKANELFFSRKLYPTLMMEEESWAKDYKPSAC